MPRIFSGKVILYFLFLMVLDVCLLPPLCLNGMRPILLYLWVLYVALKWRWDKTVFSAFAAGLVRDLAGSGPLGVETATLVFWGVLLVFTAQKVDRDSPVMQFLLSFGFIAGALLTHFVIASLLTASEAPVWKALASIFSSAAVSAFLMPFFFSLTGKLFNDRPLLKQYELF